jgi:hypothetical protein
VNNAQKASSALKGLNIIARGKAPGTNQPQKNKAKALKGQNLTAGGEAPGEMTQKVQSPEGAE